jgi:hypothetical protein
MYQFSTKKSEDISFGVLTNLPVLKVPTQNPQLVQGDNLEVGFPF